MLRQISPTPQQDPGENSDIDNLALEVEALRLQLYERQLFQEISNHVLQSKSIGDLENAMMLGLKKLFPLSHRRVALFPTENTDQIWSVDPLIFSLKGDKKPIISFEDILIIDLDIFPADGLPDEISTLRKEKNIAEAAYTILRMGARVIGHMYLLFPTKMNLDGSKLDLIRLLKTQIVIAADNIISREEILQRDLQNEVLLASSSAISSNLDINLIMGTVYEQLRKIIDFNDVGVSQYDLRTNKYKILACQGDLVRALPDFKLDLQTDFSLNDGLHDVLLHTDGPVFFDYASLKALNKPQTNISLAAGMRSVAGIRLVHNNHVIGALILTSNKDDVFSSHDFDLIQRLSHHLATAVANSKANQELSKKLEEIKSYKEQLQNENWYLQQEAQKGFSFEDIVGKSSQMQKVYHSLSQVSFTNSTVLILGETGTGKELVARAIHNSSARSEKLLVKVNCATLPAALIESELFGHERGSFTGATERRIGKFELANNGTLFLDEIGEMPVELQVKLLRAIQEREIERIGGKESVKVDVRIIAATNRDLATEVKEGRFRSDLYYRLNVFPITLPPLRDRKDDIPELARHFTIKFSRNNGKGKMKISTSAMKELMTYTWPGNVRELEHQIERSVLMASESIITQFELPVLNKHHVKVAPGIYFKSHEDNEREHIIAVLNHCNGKIYGPGGAAQLLKLKVGTLNSKIRRLGIGKEEIISQHF